MVTVKLYGLFRMEADKAVYEFENTATLNDVLDALSRETKLAKKEWKKAVIYVNGTAIDKLRMFRTPLTEGDVVSVLSPASGG